MPSTSDSRAIKIMASISKTSPKIMLTCATGAILIGLYFMGCKFGFLPGGICGANDLNSNTPSLTPVPTEAPLPIAAKPTAEQLPVCEMTENAKPPYCGTSYASDDSSYCGSDGTSFRQLTYKVSGSVAEQIMENLSKGIPLESDPAGLCFWSSIKPTEQNVYDGFQTIYEAAFTCSGPSGALIKINDSLGPETCEVSGNPCPDGYEIETSTLESDHAFYCVPEGQTNISPGCGAGMFLDQQNSCCGSRPANSLKFVCLDYQITQEGFSCRPDYNHMEKLQMGITLPSCSAPDRPRPPEDTEENTEDETREEPTACIPDPTGGGCP
ncbi:MAG: hypothetical protein C4557_12955 [Anaerolineaceae bacterium]|jgi:hypothetical protein|nr:MAG: hypothetical protein C4557_12955 [Anaerolineaceae bacterium]